MRQRDKIYRKFYFTYAIAGNLVMLAAVWLYVVLSSWADGKKLMPTDMLVLELYSLVFLAVWSLIQATVFYGMYGVVRQLSYRDSLPFILGFTLWYLPFTIGQELWMMIMPGVIFCLSPLSFVCMVRHHLQRLKRTTGNRRS